ncbi:hypothetical protein KIL84_021835 [Mauremys mutica]|uniref:Uncharacterized protein n=1 Tax=Mauremys mutica TaxID=74926 RepID=A0A9D3XGI8_9SAUR|nr:hypothetical protein KIL84_021835 [Mauremys mutica]
MQRRSSTSLTGRVKHFKLPCAWELLQQLEYSATEVPSIAITLTRTVGQEFQSFQRHLQATGYPILISIYADLAGSFVSEWSTLINIPFCITIPTADGSPFFRNCP